VGGVTRLHGGGVTRTVGERAGIGPKAEWAGRAGLKRKLGEQRIKSRKMKMKRVAARSCGPKMILGCQEKIKMFLKYFGCRFEFETKV
jgi:hypothetical protein